MADFEDSAYFADTQSAIQDLQEQSSGPTENPSDEDKSEINFYAYDSRAGIAEDAIVEFKELAASFYGSDDESTSENPKDSINDQFESSAYGSSPIEPISSKDNGSIAQPTGLKDVGAASVTPNKAALKTRSTFNERFQAIQSMGDSENKFELLYKLSEDFAFVAETYGRIIIAEKSLPIEEKTIKPISGLGGVAGGEKYIVSGILFKFASGQSLEHIYGNEENAQKVASHELKGLNSLYLASVPGLCFPMLAIVNYLGFCLIAISVLPLDKTTLKYGSSDAGITIHFDDPVLNEKMQQAGQKLNLKPHKVGAVVTASTPDIWGPGDIEGHQGLDGKYYVVDFARVFPPECPLPGQVHEKGCLLFKILRPEFVKNYKVPLSSDALTGWSSNDPNKALHNREVLEATQYIRKDLVVKFARQISLDFEKLDFRDVESTNLFLSSLKHQIHAAGINIRHLGLIRANCESETLKLALLAEMIARIFKCKLQHKLRRAISEDVGIAHEKLLDACVFVRHIMNIIFGRAKPEFWKWTIKSLLAIKFNNALTPEEEQDDFDLLGMIKDDLRVASLLKDRFVRLTGLQLSAGLKKKDPFEIFYVPGDVIEIRPRIKNMVAGDYAYACAKFLKATNLTRSLEDTEQDGIAVVQRLLTSVIDRIKSNSELASIFFERMIKSGPAIPVLRSISHYLNGRLGPYFGELIAFCATASFSTVEESGQGQQNYILKTAKLLRKIGLRTHAKSMLARLESSGVNIADIELEAWRLDGNDFASLQRPHLEEILQNHPTHLLSKFYWICHTFARRALTFQYPDDISQFVEYASEIASKAPHWFGRTLLGDSLSNPDLEHLFFIFSTPLWKSHEGGEAAYLLLRRRVWEAVFRRHQLTLFISDHLSESVFDAALDDEVKPNGVEVVFEAPQSLTPAALEKFCRWAGPSLVILSLEPNECENFDFLKLCPSLVKLTIQGSKMSSAALDSLAASLPPGCRGLELIDVHGEVEWSNLADIIVKCKKISWLGLPWLEEDSTPTNVVTSLLKNPQLEFSWSNLTILSARCTKFNDSLFGEHVDLLRLPNLKLLDLFRSPAGALHRQIAAISHPSLLFLINTYGYLLFYSGSRPARVHLSRNGVSGVFNLTCILEDSSQHKAFLVESNRYLLEFGSLANRRQLEPVVCNSGRHQLSQMLTNPTLRPKLTFIHLRSSVTGVFAVGVKGSTLDVGGDSVFASTTVSAHGAHAILAGAATYSIKTMRQGVGNAIFTSTTHPPLQLEVKNNMFFHFEVPPQSCISSYCAAVTLFVGTSM